ncbi:MAG: hypothetical protein K8S27_01910 [Candidatus Omnitrophica bacterium]|nr:hypothetical protein [Candidatus Omnitrophota bacterium]
MPKKKEVGAKEKNLMRRYLIWCYKTTKEDLDRIERYFTQRVVDEQLLKCLQKDPAIKKGADKDLVKAVDDFQQYMNIKLEKAVRQKFADQDQAVFHPEYHYLKLRFEAIEKTVVHFFGKVELSHIEALYETEMTRRILEAREHT